MEKDKKKRMSTKRRFFLMAVGHMALALDKLEGKSTPPPKLPRPGRIEIVS